MACSPVVIQQQAQVGRSRSVFLLGSSAQQAGSWPCRTWWRRGVGSLLPPFGKAPSPSHPPQTPSASCQPLSEEWQPTPLGDQLKNAGKRVAHRVLAGHMVPPHPSEADSYGRALTLRVRTPQCGHTVWGITVVIIITTIIMMMIILII